MSLSAPLLVLHLLGAAIWTGGHLVLALGVLPGALSRRDPVTVLAFEGAFERVGMTALAVQIATGLALAHALRPDIGGWLDLADPVGRGILAKLGFLVATALLALHARTRVIPRLTPATLPLLAWHIAGVTALGIGFVTVGALFRFGGL